MTLAETFFSWPSRGVALLVAILVMGMLCLAGTMALIEAAVKQIKKSVKPQPNDKPWPL